MSRISVLIPARGGSKGLLNKNMQKVGPFTLVNHSILQACHIFGNDVDIYVSTDSEEIKNAHKSFAKIIDRPAEFAKDESSTYDVIVHALQTIQTEYVCLLQPTHIFRDVTSLKNQLPEFFDSKKECGFTAVEFNGFLWNGDGVPLNRKLEYRPRRQDKEQNYLEDGAFYLFNRNVLNKNDFIWENPFLFKGLDIIDIHTQYDLDIANKLWGMQWLS